MNMTETEKWLNEDAVILDLEVEDIISQLLNEGHTLEKSIELVENTQNIKISYDT